MHAISRKTLTTVAVSGLGALAIVGGLAPAVASAAAPTYKVSVGRTATGTATLSGSTTGPLQFKDVTTSLPATCASATASGTAKLARRVRGASLASITSSSFTGCKANGQLDLAVTQVGTWTVTGNGATSGGVTPGTLTNITSNVADTDGFGCKFTIAGTVDASYNNNGTLSFAPISNFLVITKQSGNCLGLANKGDKVSLTGSFAVSSTSPAGKLSIVSH